MNVLSASPKEHSCHYLQPVCVYRELFRIRSLRCLHEFFCEFLSPRPGPLQPLAVPF